MQFPGPLGFGYCVGVVYKSKFIRSHLIQVKFLYTPMIVIFKSFVDSMLPNVLVAGKDDSC